MINTLLKSIRDGVVTIDEQARVMSVNAGWCQMTGLSREQMVGVVPPYPWWPESDLAQVSDTYTALLESDEPFESERPVRRPDGSLLTVLVSGTRMRTEDGEPEGWLLIYKDITQRKKDAVSLEKHARELEQLNEKLAIANSFNASLIEHGPDASLVVDEEGLIVSANPRSAEFFGYDHSVLTGMSVDLLVPMHARDKHPHFRRSFFANPVLRPMGQGLELVALRSDGTEVPVDILLSPFQTNGRKLTLAVARDVTPMRLVEKAKMEADRANRAKSEFLSRMSHELRTPLGALLGFTAVLQEEQDDLVERHRRMVQRMDRAGHHLMSLINDVLDISRIEAGHLSLSMEPVVLADVVERAVELTEQLAIVNGVDVQSTVGPSLVVQADHARLQQVFVNLISNAIKYNRPEGSVRIDARAEKEKLFTSVADTGLGIDAQRVSELFTPFARLGAERTQVEGTGLGLALSKALIEQMQGDLQLSASDDSGTTFVVELQSTTKTSNMTNATEHPKHFASEDVAASVLYIEDNDDNVAVLTEALRPYSDVAVSSTTTGREGLAALEREDFDIVFLDLHLPDCNGREVLSFIRSDERLQELPVVILTADALGSSRAEMVDLGANAYLTKPITPYAVISTILDHVQKDEQ